VAGRIKSIQKLIDLIGNQPATVPQPTTLALALAKKVRMKNKFCISTGRVGCTFGPLSLMRRISLEVSTACIAEAADVAKSAYRRSWKESMRLLLG
jgi:hypothetical protein